MVECLCGLLYKVFMLEVVCFVLVVWLVVCVYVEVLGECVFVVDVGGCVMYVVLVYWCVEVWLVGLLVLLYCSEWLLLQMLCNGYIVVLFDVGVDFVEVGYVLGLCDVILVWCLCVVYVEW